MLTYSEFVYSLEYFPASTGTDRTMTPLEPARNNEKRTERRYAADLPAKAQVRDQSPIEVRVSDISSTGALLIGDNLGSVNDELTLHLDNFGLVIQARIAHCGADFVGVEFSNPAHIRDQLTTWLREEIVI